MKSLFKYIWVLTALLCAISLWSCASSREKEPEETKETDTTASETTSVTPEEKPVTYTLPLSYEKEGVTLLTYSYGEDGKSLSKTDLGEERPITYTVYFDGNGAPLYTEWLVTVNDQRTELWKDIYTLDENGSIIEEKRYCEGVLQFTYTYTYDSEGRILTQRSLKAKNQSETVYTLSYDDRGTCIGINCKKNGSDEAVYREATTVTYDNGGRVLSITAPSYVETHEYHEKSGFVTNEKVTYVGNDSQSTVYYQYTYVNGKLSKADCSFNGALVDTTLYTESEFAHYEKAIEWVFRERLP